MDDVRLMIGDCLELMREIPEHSISLIVADPPYHRVKNEPWDRQWKTDGDYLSWLGEVLELFRRVLRPNGSFYLFASPRMAARVEYKVAEFFDVLSRITWRKDSGWARKQCKEEMRVWRPVSEAIIFAANDHLKELISEARLAAGLTMKDVAEIAGAHGKVNHGGAVSNWESGLSVPPREAYERLATILKLPAYEEIVRPFSVSAEIPYTDVWDFPTVPPTPDKHPCEKPLALIEHIVKASSRPGDLVLDPFMGSGATGLACRNLGRSFVGIERHTPYFRLAEHRIADAQLRLQRPHAPRLRPAKTESYPLFDR